MTTNSDQFLINITSLVASLVSIFFSLAMTPDLSAAANKTEAEAQHAELGLRIAKASTNHTKHPEAQWFPDAGLGLFLHWDQGSVRMLGTSWPMIAAPNFKKAKYKTDPATWEPAEWARIIREKDFLLDGKKGITPTFSLTNDGGNRYLTLTIQKRTTATGITLIAETCGDLATWNSSNTVIVSETASTLVVRDAVPVSESNSRFIRLKVTQP